VSPNKISEQGEPISPKEPHNIFKPSTLQNKMIVKILGSLDLIAGISFWLFTSFNFLESFMLVIALYLIAKGVLFLISKDIASALDVISGIIIITSVSYTLPTIVYVLVILYLLQKGVFSLIG